MQEKYNNWLYDAIFEIVYKDKSATYRRFRGEHNI